MARINKFATVNLNDLFGKKEPSVKTAVNSSGSGARLKGGSNGMLVLTRPVKQPVKIGSGSVGNLKKQSSESLTPTENNTSGWSNTSQIESANGVIVKDNCELVYPTNKPESYIPPSLQDLHSTSVLSVTVKPEPVTVGKTAGLHRDEFPSLQASLAPANTTGQQHRIKDSQQKQKDNQLDAKEQLGKLHQLSLQAHSKSSLDDANEPDKNRFQPQRPQFFRPPHLRGDQQVNSETVTKRPDGSPSRDSYLKGDSNTSDWADDERANGFMITPGTISDTRPNHCSICPLELTQSDYVVTTEEGKAEMKSLCYNRGMFPPPSKGVGYEREALSRVGSGGSRYYEREALFRPGSGGSRYYEREALPRPGSGGSRYEREALPRPGSGGSRYEREALPRPGSGGSRYEREALPRPGSGGRREAFARSGSSDGRFEQEALPRPGSGGSSFDQEVCPRPVSGGRKEAFTRSGSSDSRFEQEALPRPLSNGKYEREVLPRSGSGGSRFEQESLLQSVSACPSSGGDRYDRQVSSHPGSGGGMHDREVMSFSGYRGESYGSEVIPRPGSSSGFDREVISHPATGENYSRPGSGGSGYGRTAGTYYPQQGFNGDGDYLRSNSGGRHYEKKVVSRPGSGGNNGGGDYVQPNFGGRSYEREVVSRPGSVGNKNAGPVSGGVDNRISQPGSSGYSYDREAIPHPATGDSYSRPGSGGSGFGRTAGLYYPHQGFNGDNDYVWPNSGGRSYEKEVVSRPASGGNNGSSDYVRPNSGGRSYEREVVSRPGSGGNKNAGPGSGGGDNRMSQPSLGQIDGGELYRDSSFNGKQNYQRWMTNPLRGHADGHYRGRNGNIHHAYESNGEKGPSRDNWFRPGGISREFPNRDNYHGRNGANDYRHGGAERMPLEQLREREGRLRPAGVSHGG